VSFSARAGARTREKTPAFLWLAGNRDGVSRPTDATADASCKAEMTKDRSISAIFSHPDEAQNSTPLPPDTR